MWYQCPWTLDTDWNLYTAGITSTTTGYLLTLNIEYCQNHALESEAYLA